MNIAEDVDPDDKAAYPNRPAWQRFLTIFAGPATNYLSAIVLAFALYTCHGVESEWRWYGVADGPARATTRTASSRSAIASSRSTASRSSPKARGATASRLHHRRQTLTERVTAKKGAPVTLTVLRDGKKLDVTITPKLDAVRRSQRRATRTARVLDLARASRAALPARHRAEREPTCSTSASRRRRGARSSTRSMQTKMIAGGLYDIIAGKEKADPGGPKRIYDEFAKAWESAPSPASSC